MSDRFIIMKEVSQQKRTKIVQPVKTELEKEMLNVSLIHRLCARLHFHRTFQVGLGWAGNTVQDEHQRSREGTMECVTFWGWW